MYYLWQLLWKKIKSIRSLRMGIFLLLVVVGTVPSVILKYSILESYETRAVNVRISEVQTQMKIIANHLIAYNYLQDTSDSVVNAELDELSNLYDGRVLIINDHLKIVKDTYEISEGKTIISEEIVKCFSGTGATHYDAVNGYIEMTIPITETVSDTLDEDSVSDTGSVSGTSSDSTETVRGAMLISISADSIQTTMEMLNKKAVILQDIMVLFVLIIAWIFSAILVKPLNKVTKAINEVKGGFSDKAIEVPDYMETVHIIDAFNQLLGRMKVLDDSRQEFVSNVSHELKTPITSMKVLADSLLAQENAPVEIYREFLADIVAEIDRENKIITDLLALVKVDKTVSNMNITEVNMNELTEVILKRLRPIARKRDIEVTFESIRPVKAAIDEVKMTLIISNLVENAIKYNKEQGAVNVILDADHQYFTLIVSDTGIGIPTEALEHVYERFYRVDKSRSREIGGTGLGLAIAKSAVLMHRGSIEVSSTLEQGTTFVVKIPLTHIPG